MKGVTHALTDDVAYERAGSHTVAGNGSTMRVRVAKLARSAHDPSFRFRRWTIYVDDVASGDSRGGDSG